MAKKMKGHEKDDDDDDYIKKKPGPNDLNGLAPPDGGWGWVIVLAAGLSNFCCLPLIQSFGLIFRDRFKDLGISSSQTTTILNINTAVTACLGLANGPIFRKFSYRKVNLLGAFLIATSITALSTMKNFAGILVFFSVLYGIGLGFTMSSNSLALNTYFKKRRRVATGLCWTLTGLAPIVMPQFITVLMPIFSVEGTIMIFGGLAFNAIACGLLLQPVRWHTKKEIEDQVDLEQAPEKGVQVEEKNFLNENRSKSLENFVARRRSVSGDRTNSKSKFGSQYLYYDDEVSGASGLDVIGPGTPMMSRSNDGWFSRNLTSSTSLASFKNSKRETSQKNLSRCHSSNSSQSRELNHHSSCRNLSRNHIEPEGRKRTISTQSSHLMVVNESNETKLKTDSENESLSEDENSIEKTNLMNGCENKVSLGQFSAGVQEKSRTNVTESWIKRFARVLVIFFDLNLLRDKVYVNLMLGINFAHLAEINFSLLTPFILSDYGFTKSQIATTMSVLASVDVICRLTIPFVTSYINWGNRTFYLIGISTMAVGRIILAHVRDFGITIAIAVLIGAGKALRTIFMALVIPSHVPLERLPAASGLQLVTSGIIFLTFGPFVGWIRDSTSSFTATLHCLNVLTFLTVISWTIEAFCTKRKERASAVT
ncbi:uncharacterized protein LOC105699393 [Orussus abietinus]|uniref:uncharacterized protein LOC105699393 n=1 Tax=Orussus abietinus TaxID=222816 RepID=UPI0006269A62|nr:uncharacterized protein LOC105699393 [Orussus abietinus]XP_012279756.1 uncharacterized protein LOC105699393 [Orussus abietinus]XP_012279757.1 uncharacterized protein LOC105699393 [Orussus abietinus]